MFRNKVIEIWKKGEKKEGSFGQAVEGKPKLIKTIKVNVQPYFSEEALKDYGFTVDCEKVIFMDVEDINIDTHFIVYRGKKYEIKKIIEWNEYQEVLVHHV
ncbi:hypothetical protein FYJ27_08610 [Anaerosalibacter bizertensis]|uniref:Phage head-tail adapter protein n=1 Tax=Anaerosalibacter bizertensis TaxID=932217 RepID=A0A844FIN3_9FIRM|nr:hypothetical protein [Anaerosalibacter bizertensis]MSS43788.1 hypothetical protein [Anaerosalibacter bizertensis]